MSPLSQLMQKVYGRLAIGSNVYAQRDLHVGPGSRLWAPNKLTVGNGVYVGKWCTIEIDGSIGDGCLIANSVGIVGRRDHDMSILGNPIRSAPWVGDHERLASTVTIGADVWIGYGAVVLGPCRVGRGAVIAAGALVTKEVPPYAIVAGNPATIIGERFCGDDVQRHEAELLARWGIPPGAEAPS